MPVGPREVAHSPAPVLAGSARLRQRLEALVALADAQRRADAAALVVKRRALEARTAGATWAEIGSELGITPQSAHSRYRVAAVRADGFDEDDDD